MKARLIGPSGFQIVDESKIPIGKEGWWVIFFFQGTNIILLCAFYIFSATFWHTKFVLDLFGVNSDSIKPEICYYSSCCRCFHTLIWWTCLFCSERILKITFSKPYSISHDEYKSCDKKQHKHTIKICVKQCIQFRMRKSQGGIVIQVHIKFVWMFLTKVSWISMTQVYRC